MATRIVEQDPHFEELNALLIKFKNRKTKAQIFDLWEKSIKPDEPTITLRQFINWTRNFSDVDRAIEESQRSDVDVIEAGRAVSLVKMENDLRQVSGDLINEAQTIMELNEDGAVPLKERYFALTIVDKMWGKLIKEKEIAIKAHAEKRESVGMFAKLLRGAMSGEFTMKDIERLKETKNGNIEQPIATTKTIA